MKRNRVIAFLVFVVMILGITVNVFAADQSIYGKYTKHGYENSYFGYKAELDNAFELQSRAAFNLVNEDVVESANKEDTLNYLDSMVGMHGNPTVFAAVTENNYDQIYIYVQDPGIFNDIWDEEKVIAENSIKTVQEEFDDVNAAGTAVVTDIQISTESFDFVGKEHAAILYTCKMNDNPFYGMRILLRSDDKKYLNVIELASFSEENLRIMVGYFEKMK